MNIEYLLFNVVVGLGSTVAVWTLTRKYVLPELLPAVSAVGIVAIFFILVDELVANVWWYFNPHFTIGVLVGSLPVEEVMFFFSVPIACLHIWVNLKRMSMKHMSKRTASLIMCSTWCFLLCMFALTYSLPYTRLVLIALSCVPVVDILLKTNLMRSWIFVGFIGGGVNLLTLIFNGYLTARPIITYNSFMKSNIHLFTIPLEDFVYGMALISLVIVLYEYFVRFRQPPQS